MGVKHANYGDVGDVPAGAFNCIVGTAATKLDRPSGAKILMLYAQTGDWNVILGDHVSNMQATADPTASLADGTAAFKLKDGHIIPFRVGASMTVKSYSASNVLTYWWV